MTANNDAVRAALADLAETRPPIVWRDLPAAVDVVDAMRRAITPRIKWQDLPADRTPVYTVWYVRQLDASGYVDEMSRAFVCETCAAQYTAAAGWIVDTETEDPDEYAGWPVTCPNCGALIAPDTEARFTGAPAADPLAYQTLPNGLTAYWFTTGPDMTGTRICGPFASPEHADPDNTDTLIYKPFASPLAAIEWIESDPFGHRAAATA